MAIASIVRGFLNGADVDTYVTLLGYIPGLIHAIWIIAKED
jgi:uncharacterized membrane protein YqaE (UPF0057 family)